MTRQLLLSEIERIHLEKNEKRENMTDEVYVFNKYPHLASLFEQYRIGNERWFQLAREVLFYSKDDLRYMYNRIMQLIRRFGKDIGLYFDVKTEIGKFSLPDRLSDLNRLLELYVDLFNSIYININRRLRFDVYSQEKDAQILYGQVNWAKTIKHSISHGTNTCPLVFTTVFPEYEFETPENILAILSVLRLKQDALFLLQYDFIDPLTLEERAILSQIIDGCDNILKTTLLKKLIAIASKYVTISPQDPRIISLEAQAYIRLREVRRQAEPYLRLLQWRQKYRELNLRFISRNRTNFPIDRRENLDTMYELWVLFELLDYLQIYEGATIWSDKFPRSFVISVQDIDMTLFYEKEYAGWAVGAQPDFSIEINGQLKVIMDAKNWLQPKHEAIYKMLGYLNNLDGTIGILFFPNESSLSHQRVFKGINLQHHQYQLLFNCVVKPKKSDEAINEKHNALRKIANMIFHNL